MKRWLGVVAVAVAVLGASCSGSESVDAPAPAPTPIEEPSYAVGFREITVTDPARPGRELPVAVWYPVAPDVDTSGLEPTFYSLVGEIGTESTIAFNDAPPAEGPFPLIVFSHGNGGTRTQSTFLTEALARRGFVVASPDHVGNTAADLLTGAGVSQVQSALDRPLDVSAVIDDMVASDDLLVDGEHIGMTGHSFGGFTTLVMGAGDDDRIDALAPIAPASTPIGDEALASIELPTLLVGGTLDTTTPIDPNTTRPFELLGSEELYKVDVIDAGHLSFAGICAPAAEYAALPDAVPLIKGYLDGLADDGCSDEFADVESVHELTNRYVVAFFAKTLLGDDAAEDLTPVDGVAFVAR